MPASGSLVVNWLFQAFSRFEEFFGERAGRRRPLAPLQALLAGGQEQKLTYLYRMCGIVLGSHRKRPKQSPNSFSVPRERFHRRSFLVGFSRISCDVMTQSIYSLHIGTWERWAKAMGIGSAPFTFKCEAAWGCCKGAALFSITS